MRVSIFREAGTPLTVEEVTVLPLGAGDVRVRTTASGICHSDLLPLQGLLPRAAQASVLGHEGAGIVEEVGSAVTTMKPGDQVVASWVSPCFHCYWCVNQQTEYCETFGAPQPVRFTTANGENVTAGIGTFSEMMVADARSFIPIETDLPPEQLALIGCGVATGVGAVLNTAAVRPGSSVAVLGCGGVGQSAIQGARIAGASRIIAVDPVPSKGAMALQLGATHYVNPADGDALEQVRELTGGRGVDYAFEVAGRSDTASDAWAMTRRGGKVLFVGAQPPGTTPSWGSLEWIMSGKTVIGALYGSSQVHRDLPRYVRMVESGQLDLASMVSRTIKLDEVNEGLAAIETGEVIRSVILN
ncbi:MAG: Alcohol dehydrogenase zinc-binding domain protein [Frankiales bacterium]|nr:Alcohol dehydrogenase zinc-binding domain protein [Frankiales bacterium]